MFSTCSHKGEVQLSTFVLLHLLTLAYGDLLGRVILNVHFVVAELLAIKPTKLYLNPFEVPMPS